MPLPHPAPLFGPPPAAPGRGCRTGTGVLGAAVTAATRTAGAVAPSPTPRRPPPPRPARLLSGVERDRAALLGFDAPENTTLLDATLQQHHDSGCEGSLPRAPWWRRLLNALTTHTDPEKYR